MNKTKSVKKFSLWVVGIVLLLLTISGWWLFSRWPINIGDPNFWKYTTNKPDVQDVIGKYYLTDKSIEYLKKRGYHKKDIFIEIKSSEIKLNNMPKIIDNPYSTKFEGYEILTGSWKMGLDFSQEAYAIEYSYDVIENQVDTHISGEIALWGNSPPHRLFINIGDPDSGEGLIFEKVQH